MIKRDYETIAACIRLAREHNSTFDVAIQSVRDSALYDLQERIMLEFELDNPRFKRHIFVRACDFTN